MAIDKSALSFTAVVPTTRVAHSLEGQGNQSEQWAVLDSGRTLAPYSEAFEGTVTRRWAERIAGTKTMGFQLDGKAGESLGQPILRNRRAGRGFVLSGMQLLILNWKRFPLKSKRPGLPAV